MIPRYVVYPGLTEEQRIHLGEAIRRTDNSLEVMCIDLTHPPKSIPYQVIARVNNAEKPVIVDNTGRSVIIVADLLEQETKVYLDSEQGRSLNKLVSGYIPPVVSRAQAQ
jgi:hypothetical protein